MVKYSHNEKVTIIQKARETTYEEAIRFANEEFGKNPSSATLSKWLKEENTDKKNIKQSKVKQYEPLLNKMYEFFVKNRDNLEYNEQDIELLKQVQKVINE